MGPSLKVLQKRAMDVSKLLLPYEPTDVLTAQLAEQLYGIPCVVHPDPNTGRPVVLPR